MKGLTHLVTGVAVASCFPQAVAAGANGAPSYFILAAVCGILPDTIDFKVLRFFAKRDMEISPDPLEPDPQMIADAVAAAINHAYETGRACTIKLNTIRVSADLWRRYEVRFDSARQRVVVKCGPLVTTGGTPVAAGSAASSRPAAAPVACRLVIGYRAVNVIDIFEGPTFRMAPHGDSGVYPEFIPWHRTWSHGLVLAALCAAAGAILAGPLGGLVAFAACASHIALDHLGFLGSSILYPFRKKRTPGLGMMHSGDSTHNFLVVWTCCLVVTWNLACSALGATMPFNPAQLALYAGAIPLGLFWLADKLLQRTWRSRAG